MRQTLALGHDAITQATGPAHRLSGGARLGLGASVVALSSVAHFNRYSGPALDQLALAHPIPEGKDHADASGSPARPWKDGDQTPWPLLGLGAVSG